MLAETDAALPPILVNRTTMRVIDGMHRLRAAALRGDEQIEVRYFDGDPETAFVRAVEANATHGLPLTLADREAAAARIIASHPRWSDRAIASTTGLAPATVAAIRRRSTGFSTQSNTRIGRDGRVRPLNSAEGRRRAGAVLAARPDTSLRQVAEIAGISLGTANDVRDRLRRGEDPVPDGVRAKQGHAKPDAGAQPGQGRRRAAKSPYSDLPQLLQALRKDPALRLTESGRILLRLLEVQAISSGDWEDLISSTPAHCLPSVAQLARGCAETWSQLAIEFDKRAKGIA
ncbi:ParB/RepB/Spo0J family partition protein [Lentzea atacamensis]